MALALTGAMFGCSRSDERPTAQPASPVVTGSPTASADATPPAPTPTPAGGAKLAVAGGGAPAAPDGPSGAGAPGARPAQAGAGSALPEPTRPVAGDPSCSTAVLLAATKSLVDDRSAGVTVDRVDVFGCRNAYARLIALPAENSAPLLKDQVFLRQVGGTWRLAGLTGAGIDCGDNGLPAEIAAACAAIVR
ncbi:hypothetical protein [Micromonospora sp. DT47]|uniref:hypothetical protein n=1 Tax=Micromonospora sp. DT47 TaxID=3393431 RepID=UPI003CF23210